jgi:hypothetical protein
VHRVHADDRRESVVRGYRVVHAVEPLALFSVIGAFRCFDVAGLDEAERTTTYSWSDARRDLELLLNYLPARGARFLEWLAAQRGRGARALRHHVRGRHKRVGSGAAGSQ